jgi:hypothetical protein
MSSGKTSKEKFSTQFRIDEEIARKQKNGVEHFNQPGVGLMIEGCTMSTSTRKLEPK